MSKKDFVTLSDGTKLHIPTLELFLNGGLANIKQGGENNLNIIYFSLGEMNVTNSKITKRND